MAHTSGKLPVSHTWTCSTHMNKKRYPMGYDDKGGWIPEVGDERVVRNLVRT